MSNDLIRLTFPGGSQLYTVGDAWSTQCDRLFPSQEEAWNAYCKDWTDIDISVTESEIALVDDEQVVLIETKYGAEGWSEMITPYCRASLSDRIITYGPAYSSRRGEAEMLGYG